MKDMIENMGAAAQFGGARRNAPATMTQAQKAAIKAQEDESLKGMET